MSADVEETRLSIRQLKAYLVQLERILALVSQRLEECREAGLTSSDRRVQAIQLQIIFFNRRITETQQQLVHLSKPNAQDDQR